MADSEIQDILDALAETPMYLRLEDIQAICRHYEGSDNIDRQWFHLRDGPLDYFIGCIGESHATVIDTKHDIIYNYDIFGRRPTAINKKVGVKV